MLRFLFLAIFCLILNSEFLFAASKKLKYPDLILSDYVFLIDHDSKEVILEKNADVKISPSSMTKLMTAYVVFDQLKKGKIFLNNQCLIGKEAWEKSGSTMFLNYGDVVTVNQLLTGLLVVSGNDAAVALAEIVSGNDDKFSELMNITAKRIGLKNSNFKNPHGLNQDGHYMTLRDIATLSIRIIDDFPEYSHYFSLSKFTYQNITQNNRNPLISDGYDGVTGMKTGYTSKGGYGIVATVDRDGRRLVAVTNGAKTATQRKKIITQVLDYGFDNYNKITVFNSGNVIAKAKVLLGNKDQLEVVSKQDVAVTIPKGKTIDDLKVEIKYKEDIVYAPISSDKEIATLTIKFADRKIKQLSLFAKENIDKVSSFDKIWEMAKYKSHKFFSEIF